MISFVDICVLFAHLQKTIYICILKTIIYKYIPIMKQARILLFIFVISLIAACGTTRTVPVTGRKQTISVSDEDMLSLSTQEYNKFMQSAKASTDAANTAMVKRVGQKLATAVEAYLRQNGMAADLKSYQWEFNLVADNQVNAFCMPGGKIVVYEGLLPITQNEACLAVVLGHEIAHAVARHSAEQISKQQRQQTGLQIGAAVAGALGVGSGTTNVVGTLIAQGIQLRNLKYSRDHEHEADHIGLIFAAMAGYNPQEAVGLWQRMAAQGGSKTAEFLSSHPSDEKRIANIQKWMPEALKYYKP